MVYERWVVVISFECLKLVIFKYSSKNFTATTTASTTTACPRALQQQQVDTESSYNNSNASPSGVDVDTRWLDFFSQLLRDTG
jgi:hypothetical protein